MHPLIENQVRDLRNRINAHQELIDHLIKVYDGIEEPEVRKPHKAAKKRRPSATGPKQASMGVPRPDSKRYRVYEMLKTQALTPAELEKAGIERTTLNNYLYHGPFKRLPDGRYTLATNQVVTPVAAPATH